MPLDPECGFSPFRDLDAPRFSACSLTLVAVPWVLNSSALSLICLLVPLVKCLHGTYKFVRPCKHNIYLNCPRSNCYIELGQLLVPESGRGPSDWAAGNGLLPVLCENDSGKLRCAFVFSRHVQPNTSRSGNMNGLRELGFLVEPFGNQASRFRVLLPLLRGFVTFNL